jgi:hypothetical protein
MPCRSRRGDKGRDDRKFLEALHYFTVHNITWRALPAEFGVKGFGVRIMPSGVMAAKTKCARSGTHRRSYFGAAAVFRKHVCLLMLI